MLIDAKKQWDRKKIYTASIFVILVFSFAFNVWKSFYGYCSTDESFFLTLAHRFIMGDAPVVDEWHPTQFAGMLITPLFWLYTKINGSTTGILLFFRISYSVITAVCSLILAKKTDSYLWGSCAAVAFFALYSKAQMGTLDYNSIGISCVLLCSLILCFDDRMIRIYLCGILFAAAVLCTPHLAILYFGVTVFLGVQALSKRGFQKETAKKWIAFTMGSLSLATVIIVFMLSKASLARIIRNFPYLFKSDPSHKALGFGPVVQTLALFKMVWLTSKLSTFIVPIYAVLALAVIFDKNKSEHAQKYLLISVLLSAVLLFAYINKPVYDYSSIVLTPIGLIVILLDPAIDRKLKMFWLCGIGYIFMINLSSDTVIAAASSASVISGIASLLLLYQYYHLNASKFNLNRMLRFSVHIFCALLVLVEIDSKFTMIYRDESPMSLHFQITEGPAKGLITTQENKAKYDLSISALNQLQLEKNKKVFLVTDQAWMYLYLEDKSYGTYSAWFKPHRESYVKLLDDYYMLNPQKVPDAVFMPADTPDYFFKISAFGKKYHMQLKMSKFGYYLYKDISQ